MSRMLFQNLECIFYHQNKIMIFCTNFMFFTLNFFHLQLIIFSLNKTSSCSLNSTEIFTPFAVLTSVSSSETKQYIFDFNKINLLIEIPLHLSLFQFDNNSFVSWIKKIWLKFIKVKQVFVFEQFFITTFDFIS